MRTVELSKEERIKDLAEWQVKHDEWGVEIGQAGTSEHERDLMEAAQMNGVVVATPDLETGTWTGRFGKLAFNANPEYYRLHPATPPKPLDLFRLLITGAFPTRLGFAGVAGCRR